MAEQLIVNSYELSCARADFLQSWGGSLDAKRPTAWNQYGYKEDLTFSDFRRAYERGGPAHGAVHKLLGRCWLKKPRIKSPAADAESAWETKVNKALKAIGAWAKLKDFDRRNMVGRFSALIYRVADGKKLSDPLTSGGRGLVDIVALFEDQIRVTKWNEDEGSEDYGQPMMFQYRMRSPTSRGDTQAKPETWVDVHPSRVQILAEGSAGGDFFEGQSLLAPGFNCLVDMEKCRGGGAESALKNSARTIAYEYDKDSQVQSITSSPEGAPTGKTVRQVHAEQTRELNRNLDAAIVLQGGKANTLQTQVQDLSAQWGIAANEFAASVEQPFTILFGQQTGRLASDEDQKEMNARAGSRQDDLLTPMLTEFVTRMQACGIFEAGEFEIEWPDLGAPTDDQRLANAVQMAAANLSAFNGGSAEPIFDIEEIRKVAGYEEREGEGDQFKEADPALEPNTPPTTDPKADPTKKPPKPAAK